MLGMRWKVYLHVVGDQKLDEKIEKFWAPRPRPKKFLGAEIFYIEKMSYGG
jgi:hypothetical protein